MSESKCMQCKSWACCESCGNCTVCDDPAPLEERIAELEAVAEAAVRMWNSDGLTDDLVQSLQNAGYSVEIGEHL